MHGKHGMHGVHGVQCVHGTHDMHGVYDMLDVDVDREPWMESNCVGIRGDKGQVADLMRKPVLLFDDHEENIALLRLRSSPNLYLDGVLVRRGRKADIPVPPGYLCYNDPESGYRYVDDLAVRILPTLRVMVLVCCMRITPSMLGGLVRSKCRL